MCHSTLTEAGSYSCSITFGRMVSQPAMNLLSVLEYGLTTMQVWSPSVHCEWFTTATLFECPTTPLVRDLRKIEYSRVLYESQERQFVLPDMFTLTVMYNNLGDVSFVPACICILNYILLKRRHS